jgi:hypothetical protein
LGHCHREHSYGDLQLYIKPYGIKKIENWYYPRRNKITWDNIDKIYFLMKQMSSINANDIDGLESSYNEIDSELKKLRID